MLSDFKTNSLVVFEGPDGGGKTSTIAKLGLKARHTGGPPDTAHELLERVASIPRAGILDRWPVISEYVYGPLRPAGCFVPLPRLLDLARVARDQRKGNLYVVYCCPPSRVLAANASAQVAKDHKSAEFIELVKRERPQIYDRYETIIVELEETLGIWTYRHDYIKDLHAFKLAYNLTHPSSGRSPIFYEK